MPFDLLKLQDLLLSKAARRIRRRVYMQSRWYSARD